MEFKYLIFPEAVDQPEQVGSKGWFLVRGMRAGLLVPETVFVTVDAFRHFISHRELLPYIDQLQKQLNAGVPQSDWKAIASELQKAFTEAEPLPELAAELEQAMHQYEWLRKSPLAVRSSGVKEDSVDHSFAGQFETILDVEPQVTSVLAAIHRVWASEWNWQNLVYHQQKRLPLSRIGMGIIIQRMLHPRYAGVTFTVNPTNTERKELVIEYVEGVGEALVSGEKTPHRIVVERSSFEVKAGKNTPLFQEFPELPQHFQRIEAAFHMFVDVEWAIENNRLYILQIRPITKIQGGTQPNYLWTDENVGEVIPDVVTPLTWSILRPMVNGAFLYFIRKSGVPAADDLQLFDTYKNKVYFNSTLFNQILQNFYLRSPRKANAHHNSRLSLFTHLFFRLVWVGYRILRLTRTLPKEIYRTEKEYQSRWAMPPDDPRAMSVDENWQAIEAILQDHHRVMNLHVSCTIMGELFYQILDKLAHIWMPADKVIGAEALLQGIGEAESIRSGLALRRLAEEIARFPEIRSIFLNQPPEAIADNLVQLPEGPRILELLNEFFREYGHGALHEFELYFPRWSEDPAYIYNTLKQYLQQEKLPPLVTFRKADRQKRVRQAAQQLQGPLAVVKRVVFNWVRRKAEFFTIHRENLKQILVRQHFRLKKHLLAIAHQFQQQGWLQMPEDVFFLTLEEMEQLVQRGYLLSGSPKELVRQRRREREAYLQVEHPKKIRQIGDQWVPEVEETPVKKGGLTGIGCSNGIVEGPARVVRSEADFTTVQQGEILVATATNPGWTPLFVLVKGVVTEIGGALSHGAIIAREYGIPMVAGVPEATRKIRTGDIIRVNGTLGTVEIINQKAEVPHG